MDQGRIAWKKNVRDALCSVDDLVQRQIFPPQVTVAARHISHDGNYPITYRRKLLNILGLKKNQLKRLITGNL